tara:strand:- start:683 stop:808 length:126 start_codon:yes stop_codon:yes gene_type:complete
LNHLDDKIELNLSSDEDKVDDSEFIEDQLDQPFDCEMSDYK